MSKKLSWKPMRHPTTYCSPACGGGCTLEAYEEAVRKADILSRKLGLPWKPRVWENLGWHYSVVFGSSSVSESGGRYHADVHCGRQFMADDEDPRKALKKAIALCDAAMEAFKKEREELRNAEVE